MPLHFGLSAKGTFFFCAISNSKCLNKSMTSGTTVFSNFKFMPSIKPSYKIHYLQVLVMNTFKFLILIFRGLIRLESRLCQGFNSWFSRFTGEAKAPTNNRGKKGTHVLLKGEILRLWHGASLSTDTKDVQKEM